VIRTSDKRHDSSGDMYANQRHIVETGGCYGVIRRNWFIFASLAKRKRRNLSAKLSMGSCLEASSAYVGVLVVYENGKKALHIQPKVFPIVVQSFWVVDMVGKVWYRFGCEGVFGR